MGNRFVVMFYLTIMTNNLLLLSIGLYSLIFGNMWFGTACFILSSCEFTMIAVLFNKVKNVNVNHDKNGHVTSIETEIEKQ